MRIHLGSTGRTLMALSAVAVITSACDRRDDTAVARSDTAAGTIAPNDTLNRPMTDRDWTDESIIAYLRAANRDEIKVNELAAKKATTPAVKEFARTMVADHRAALKELESMIPKTKAHDSTHAMAKDSMHEKAHDVMDKSKDEIKDLTDKDAGVDWDKDYLAMQIDEHKDVLDKLQDAAKNTTDKDLQKMLIKVSGSVQEHLTKAEAIKASFK